MADQYSPLPWWITLDDNVRGADDTVVALVSARTSKTKADNAALICRAVNNHYALLAALKAFVQPSIYHEHYRDGASLIGWYDREGGSAAQRLERARAAIANAEGSK